MPSYGSLLVLALAASTVTPVLAAEVAIQPPYGILYFGKKNEGRAQALSRIKLVERADPEVPQANPPVPAAPAPENGFKLDWKIPTVIGTTLAVNGLLAWALVSAYKARKKANQSNSATPRNSDAYEPPNRYSPNETFTGQPTNPPSTNNDPNSRREERPRGRRSPVSKARHWQEARFFSNNVRRTSSHLDLLSRADLGEALDLFSRMLDKLD